MQPPPTPVREPEIIVRELTPEDRYRSAKAKAEGGDSQAQYELGLFYSHDRERAVAVDYFEAFTWTQKAAQRNHRMAQRLLARFHELGRGTDKNLEEAIKWYRSSALLGCKQSQRWMGQMYHSTYQGSKVYEDFIKKDSSNLSEAYAWFLLGAEKSIPNRPDIKKATSEELAFGPALLARDYDFETATQGTSEGERDNVAKNPNFTRAISDSAKARFAILQDESQEYRNNNKPR
jgi:TPR repeat protein